MSVRREDWCCKQWDRSYCGVDSTPNPTHECHRKVGHAGDHKCHCGAHKESGNAGGDGL